MLGILLSKKGKYGLLKILLVLCVLLLVGGTILGLLF